MIPVTVLAMGLQVLFIKLGLNNTVTGVILIHLIASLPYAVRLLIDGTQAVGNRLEEQARVLGASAWKAFFHTTLPMLSSCHAVFFTVWPISCLLASIL